MNGSNKIAAAIVVAGLLIACSYAISHRYEYTPFTYRQQLDYVVKQDKWTGRSCVTAGNEAVLELVNLPFC